MQQKQRSDTAIFARHASEWHDPLGPHAPLHALNPVRLDFIHTHVCAHYGLKREDPARYQGTRILDIGCGGGLTALPLARLGASVTAIDTDPVTIEQARDVMPSGIRIDYRCGTVEDLVSAKTAPFDCILALEVIEHVDHPPVFIDKALSLLRPGGLVFLSTLNRTPLSFLTAIVGAEYITGLVPRGTHDWRAFIRPSELGAMLQRGGADVVALQGIVPAMRGGFRLSSRALKVNYILCAQKRSDPPFVTRPAVKE